jgi:hypothetical protein
MNETVSPGGWRLTIGLLLGVVVVTLGLAIGIARGNALANEQRLLNGFDDRWSIITGTLTADRLELRADGLALHPLAPPAYSFEARVVGSGASAAGLIVNAPDEHTGLAFMISRDGYFEVSEVRAGQWLDRSGWREWPHVRRGDQPNVLRADCDRAGCTFFVNDEWTWRASNRSAGGSIGLITRGAGAATFDQVRVWRQ